MLSNSIGGKQNQGSAGIIGRRRSRSTMVFALICNRYIYIWGFIWVAAHEHGEMGWSCVFAITWGLE